MIASAHAVKAFNDMEDTGVLEHIIPELLELKGVAQPLQYHREGDVWDHSMQALGSLNQTHTLEERWAVLLHDIAKPQTFQQKERIRYDHHAEMSGEMSAGILKRLKFPRKFIDRVVFGVKHHFMMEQLIEMPVGRQRSWFLKPEFPILMTVFEADIAGTTPSDYEMFNKLRKVYDEARAKMKKEPRKLLSGEEVMEILGLKPGPRLGEIIEELR
jgi:poly(A) polymerase